MRNLVWWFSIRKNYTKVINEVISSFKLIEMNDKADRWWPELSPLNEIFRWKWEMMRNADEIGKTKDVWIRRNKWRDEKKLFT